VSNARTSVAVVGLGYWGPNRLRVLDQLPGAEVTWICDLDASRLERLSGQYREARATADFAEALADPELDAVVISTPVFSHYALASQAIAAGKHVFVEKPIAASSGEAVDLIAQAEQAGVRLMCGHTFVYSPPVQRIKEIIDCGELGEIYFVSSSRVNLGPYRSDVSVIFDLGPHDISILRYWLGELPARVGAVGRAVINPDVADVAFLDLTFPDGLLANVELSWLSPSKLRRTVISGSRKMLVYADGSPEPIRIYDSGIDIEDTEDFGEYQLSYRTGDIVSLRVAPTEPIVAELEDFIDSIQNGSSPASDLALTLDVLRVVEAAEQSMEAGGAPVDLTPIGATSP
jgi:predicted dehydrogenase